MSEQETAPEVASSQSVSAPEAPVDPLKVSPDAPIDAGPPLALAPVSGSPPWLALGLAALVPALVLFALPPLTRSGLWDPYELNVADLARRIATNLFQAQSLALEGADNSMPHLNDLGRPELPFTSIAYGFKLFGLHEWAGRLPLALWGFVGVLATFAWVSRLIDRRAGVYASVALSTMPLFFVQARTMLGDVVTLSAVSIAFGGLAVAAFDRRETGGLELRLVALAAAILGLVAGYYSRGAIIGVAVPLLGVGLAWAILWVAGSGRRLEGLGDLVGLSALVAGAISLYIGVKALQHATATDLSMSVGFMLKTPAKYPTFDFVIGQLGAALAPWSAFIPFAMGRMWLTPMCPEGVERERESSLRVAVLVAASVAFCVHAFIASKSENVPFVGCALFAAACAIALRDYERGARPSLAVGVGTAAFLGLFHHDFHELPERAYQAFAVTGAAFPESFKAHALQLWTVSLVGFAALTMLTWAERDAERKPFDPRAYLAVVNNLRKAWDGMLALGYLAMVAGASIAGAVIFAGVKLKATWVSTISLQIRDGVLNAWWLTAVVPLAIIFGTYFACDLWLWAFHRARPLSFASLTRGFEPIEALFGQLKGEGRAPTKTPFYADHEWRVAAVLLFPLMILAAPAVVFGALHMHGTRLSVAAALAIPSGVAVFLVLGIMGDVLHRRGDRVAAFGIFATGLGIVLSMFYYPALANQLSPKEVFESFEGVHKKGEPLALFGVGGRTAAYYAGGQPTIFADTAKAFDWLMADGSEGHRRYLAVRADELAKLNRMYREKGPKPSLNLPILDGRSSQILLASSALLPGEKNQNPFDKILIQSLPEIQHKLDVNMEDKLMVVGYDFVDGNGRYAESLVPGRKVHMRTYYKVLGPVTTEWEAFIHIDGFRRRHNGDHKPLDGKYPFALWLRDDLIVDDYEFSLEPNFSPGSYVAYFGLFVGETRLKVTSGPSDGEHRINGGPIRVQ